MTQLVECRIKPYIQPFERRLAFEELRALTRSRISPVAGSIDNALSFKVRTSISSEELCERLAYWELVRAYSESPTRQVLREATVNIVRNGIPLQHIKQLIPGIGSVLPNRRCLRYGTHGLHEYRGKFFPQLVRSLINIARVPRNAVVADSMCGSGTTLVEAVLGGQTGIGLDMNPLSVLMTETKCSALFLKPEDLTESYNKVRQTLLKSAGLRRTNGKLAHFSALPEGDQRYLQRWFSEQVLCDLDQIMQVVRRVKAESIRNVMLLAVSNILRRVSWQKNDDLRVRKEIRLDTEIDSVREFLEELGRSVRLLLAFLYQSAGTRLGRYEVKCADGRHANTPWAKWLKSVDVVVTSPPYATALPYLDTDRLSLSYLGLLQRSLHRERDQDMIGNREITEKTRLLYWKEFEELEENLPSSVVRMVRKVADLNQHAAVGFRRRNLPSLLGRYFADMREVFAALSECLKPGGAAFVVVGCNHTIAGGTRVDINTPVLLVDIAEQAGFHLVDRVAMEMLVSRDIFRNNAVASEEILWLRLN